MTKESWKSVRLGGAFIVLAALAAYQNSFSVPFVFDDAVSITENRTIRQLWPIWRALSPPRAGEPVTGRPMVNLSLAVNYAFGGTAVWGYHALNLAIHILAGLALFGVVRRTLLQPTLCGRFGTAALPLALATAVLWTVHPLQTESVTYVVQRAESLMGLFYLLTLCFFIRGAGSHVPRIWYSLSVAACLLGMASKEVMVSAPLIVLLYDRTFVGGSLRRAWGQRWRLYVGLGGTWLLLGYLVASTGNRGGLAGFGTDIAWWAYALTQFRAIVHYLGLSVWPHPLVFDYGTDVVQHAAEVVPYALIVALLVAGTVIALRRWPAIGFVGGWFFGILALTSSVMPVAGQTMAEHRMYLPLAAVVTLVVIGIYTLIGWRNVAVCLALAVGLGFLTAQRNRDYRSELALWSDTVTKRPSNPRAHSNLGVALADQGQLAAAIVEYTAALRIKPDLAEAHNNLGVTLTNQGKVSEAIAEFAAALRIKPDYAKAHNSLGVALADQGKVSEAIAEYTTSLWIKPDYVDAHNNLGLALASQGRISEAIVEYTAVLRIKPDYAEAHNNLGLALASQGRISEAIAEFAAALRIKPDYAEAHNNLGAALAGQGRAAEAIAECTAALRIKPDLAEAHNNLGVALASQGRISEAIAEHWEALRLRPDLPPALYKLAWILATHGNANFRDAGKAVQLAERLCAITGSQQAEDLDVLAAAYAEAGRFSDAIRVAQKAVELANAAGQRDLARQIQERLKLYQADNPYRDGSVPAP